MVKKKSSDFSEKGIDSLAKDKPVVYKIKDKNGKNIYTGVAKKGRVGDRLKEHLPDGPDPIKGGKKVSITQKNSIADAEKSETRIIKKEKPVENKKGKQ